MHRLKSVNTKILTSYKSVDETAVNELLAAELVSLNKKIVVLDDDPTGVQTVHGVTVYTDWSINSIEQAFNEINPVFFILTNSRGLTIEQAKQVNIEIATRVEAASKNTGKDYILVSRSDSTLRGHYPLETETLKTTIESISAIQYDGEIIVPFFIEGGRYTIDNIHYVKEGDYLIPAGMTEFAKDKTFGYVTSHLGDWCEEKTNGQYKREDCTYISLEEIRDLHLNEIEEKLLTVSGFGKIIVNSIDYLDLKIFCITLVRALKKSKRYIIRSAASFVKVIGGISDKPLLEKSELISEGNANGGIILVGSHVNKTTQQLEALNDCLNPVEMIEFNQHRVISPEGLQPEIDRVIQLAEDKIKSGQTVAIFTRRDRFDLPTENRDEQLKISVKISDAVTSIIGQLHVQPRFIIAKGGITSSDVGTKALKVKKAMVMGQVKPGIPVWMTGEESKFPHMPYIIFPGNVGEASTLKEIVDMLMA